ncbi:hypothetical protein AB5N19_09975 [Seiridium cardinale]
MSAPQPDDISDTPSVRSDGGAVTDWAAQYLTPEEKDSLEVLVADLWDCIYYKNEDTRKESRDGMLDGIKSWRWKGAIKKERGVAYFSAFFRFFMVEMVNYCPGEGSEREDYMLKGLETKRDLIWPRLKSLIEFLHALDAIRVVGSECVLERAQVIDDIIAICEGVFNSLKILAFFTDLWADPVYAPHYVVYGEPPQFRNFQMFCLFLHKQHILQHLAPAEFALKTFFDSGKKDDETLYWVCQWLINAAGDIYDAVSNAKENWALWHLTILAQVMVYEREVQAEPDSYRRKELLTCSKAAEFAMRRIPGTTRFNDPEMQVAMDLYFKASNEVKATLEAERKQIMDRIAELEKEMDLIPMPEKQK